MTIAGVVLLEGLAAAGTVRPFTADDAGGTVTIATDAYHMSVEKVRFRYGFWSAGGDVIAPPHPHSGLEFLGSPAAATEFVHSDEESVALVVTNAAGAQADVRIQPLRDYLQISIMPRPADAPARMVARTGSVSPAFGLGDHMGYRRPAGPVLMTEIRDFVDEQMAASRGFAGRLISNFVICPGRRFAHVNIEPGPKIVRITGEEHAQGTHAGKMSALYYFFGEPKTIYRNFLEVRQRHGYQVYPPKYALFGVGWEAWGALEWDTNQHTVADHVNRYLDLGYPLQWMVIGSGFWPRHEERFHATTSFGIWDERLYPDPRGLIAHFHGRGLKVLLGLRIAFITDGPFAADGVRGGYFRMEGDEPKVYRIGFPRSPVYLLDTANPEAVSWYIGLCGKWLDFGVDGFKEDVYGHGQHLLPDDQIDPVNAALMDRGVYVMGRNGYLGSPMDLHRFEDFNFNQSQDRGPINGLCLAYSGFPNVYPDMVGGAPSTGGLKEAISTPRAARYLMREAWYAASNPSMAFGIGVWETGDPQVLQTTLEAARLHARLQPYIYSAAVDAARTGFPYPMTPLPLVWPDDPEVYRLENSERRGYQWLIGESLLAVPLYGDDYETAETRDVYLPAGAWMDYDTGRMHEGPATLHGFELPIGKTPLFVGGQGIVVEQPPKGGPLVAAVYPMAAGGGSLRFTHPDGESISTITVRAGRWAPDRLQVRDVTAGTSIPAERDDLRRAIRFPIRPGHHYESLTP